MTLNVLFKTILLFILNILFIHVQERFSGLPHQSEFMK